MSYASQLPSNQQAALGVQISQEINLDLNAAADLSVAVNPLDTMVETMRLLLARLGAPAREQAGTTVAVGTAEQRVLTPPDGVWSLRKLMLWCAEQVTGSAINVRITGLTHEPLWLTVSTGVPQTLDLDWMLPVSARVEIAAFAVSGSTGWVAVSWQLERVGG